MDNFNYDKYDIKRKLNKNFLSRLKSYQLKKLGKKYARNYDIGNTIFISAVPRGGSTWLFETLLELIDESLGVWEPLCFNGNANAQLTKLNFNSRQFINPQMKEQKFESFFYEILTGQVPNLYYIPLKYANLSTKENLNLIVDSIKLVLKKFEYLNFITDKIKNKKHLVIKTVRSHRLLRYLTKNFEIALYILLVRHPCAVVASQLFHGRWDDAKEENNIKFPVVNKAILKKNQWIKRILIEIDTPEKHLAFTWSLDMLHPLSAKKPYPWFCVTYEDLVIDGVSELKKIFNLLNMDISTKKIEKVLQIPSSTTKNDSNVIQGGNKLATWKKRLSEKEIKNILNIVNLFGFDFYDENLKPDKEKFSNWKPKYELVY